MLSYTVGEAIEKRKELARNPYGREEPNHMIYVYQKTLTTLPVLYVGASYNPFRRLCDHIAADRNHQIGAEIRRNLPHSLEWIVSFLTVRECELFVCFYLPLEYKRYLHYLSLDRWPFKPGYRAMDIAEQALINCFRPSFNKRNRVRFD